MRRTFAPYMLALFLTLSLTALAQTARPAAPAPAPTGPAPTKVGVIQFQQAILFSNEGQRDFGALMKHFEPKQNELQALNKEIEDLKKQLTVQGDKLNEDERANRVKTIEQKQKNLQRSAEDAQNDFQAQRDELMTRIGQKLVQTLDKYAKENGFAVILDVSNPQSPVLWAGAPVDVTKDIMDAYNVQSGVPPPPAAPAPAAAAPGAATRRPATTAPTTSNPK